MPLTWVVPVSLCLVSKETLLEDSMDAMARTYDRINWTTSHPPRGRWVGNLNGSSADSRDPLGSPLQPHSADRLGTTRPNNRGAVSSSLTRWDSQGAGFADGSARGLSCSAFAEALCGTAGVSWIRAACHTI